MDNSYIFKILDNMEIQRSIIDPFLWRLLFATQARIFEVKTRKIQLTLYKIHLVYIKQKCKSKPLLTLHFLFYFNPSRASERQRRRAVASFFSAPKAT